MSAHPVTLAGPCEAALDPIKGSRFIGWAGPAPDRAACDAAVAAQRALHPDARHHCWAWVGFGPTDLAFSDAGEPNGSAGRPILDVLQGHGLSGVVVVITRWFGGTKLGVGGLVRAYGAAANATLDEGEPVELVPQAVVQVAVDYGDLNPVEAALTARGLAPERAFGAGVTFTVELPAADAPELVAAVTDATAGRAVITRPDDEA